MKIFLTSLCCFLITCCVCAQEEGNIRSYLNAANNYALIYTGKEEPRYKVKILNHPYLDTEEFREGALQLDGKLYLDVMMRLNQDLEELVVLSPNRSFSVLVPKEQLDYAVIDSLFIIYHKPVSADGKILPEGYYIRMYDGKCQVWKRKTSFLNTRINDMSLEYFFENSTKMYVYKEGIYHPVSNKRSVFKLFVSKKKELKKIVKQSGLNYRENPEKALVVIAKYYDELSK